MNPVRISLLAFLLFFAGECYVFLHYYFTGQQEALFLGSLWLGGSLLICGLLLFRMRIHQRAGRISPSEARKSYGLLSLNLPIGIILALLALKLTHIARIEIRNNQEKYISELTMEGCQDMSLGALEPGEVRKVWVDLEQDCEILIRFREDDLPREMMIVPYTGPGMGGVFRVKLNPFLDI